MPTVVIIGAGDLGASAAHALAARDCSGRILLVDAAASAAAGKALDILQMGSIQGFHTRLEGSDDETRLAGCDACIIADRFGRTSPEWQGEEALAMLRRVAPYTGDAPVVFAGASHAPLLLDAVRDVGMPHRRVVGSASEAFRSAVAAIVAMEARCSPREIALTVLGAPGRFVVPWSEASIGGYALQQVLSQVQLTRIEARAARLWPPGPYALGMAAAAVTQALLEAGRTHMSVLSVLAGEFGVKDRVGALPALLTRRGIDHTFSPSLNARERVLVESSLMAT